MRSTMFNGNQLNPSNIIDFHLSNLEKLLEGLSKRTLAQSDPGILNYLPNTASRELFKYTTEQLNQLCSMDLAFTMSALQRLKEANNDFAQPILAVQVKALMNTPAIANTWTIIMEYKPLQNMSRERRELITSILNEMLEARRVEVMHLQQEQNQITALMGAVTKRERPVEEFASMKNLVNRISAGNSTFELEQHYFNDLCKIIATSEDPELSFQQIYAYIYDKGMHSAFRKSLNDCNASKEEFNRFFGTYGYQPDNKSRQVSNPDRFGRYGEYDRQQQLHPGYQR